ncbi:hypothetical protein GGH96_001514 [Coemansia sp. RSA 1972]|nr:hypothetical protein GGH96_001514 [Coemansia sp. RSA 1972]
MTQGSHSHDPPGGPAMEALESSNAHLNSPPAQLPIALGNSSAGQAPVIAPPVTAGVRPDAATAGEDMVMTAADEQAPAEKDTLLEQAAELQSVIMGVLAECGVTEEHAARLGFRMVSKEEMDQQEQQRAMAAALEQEQSVRRKMQAATEQIQETETVLAELKKMKGEKEQKLVQSRKKLVMVMAQADANRVPTASEQAREMFAADKTAALDAEIEWRKKDLLRRRRQGTKMPDMRVAQMESGQRLKPTCPAAPTADSSAHEQNGHEAEVTQVISDLAKLNMVVQSGPTDHCPDSTRTGQSDGQIQIKMTPSQQPMLEPDLMPDRHLLAEQSDPNSVEHVQPQEQNGEEADLQMQHAEWRSHLRCEPEWQEQAQDSSLVMASVNVNGLPQEDDVAVDELVNIMGGFGVGILALQDTRLTTESAERLGKLLETHQLGSKFSCAPVSGSAQQNGVAVLLSQQIRNHLAGFNEVFVGSAQVEGTGVVPRQALGTGIRLRLAFRSIRELHVIVVYMPHKDMHPEAWVRTQLVVTQWIKAAQSKGNGLLVLGDFNEQIYKGSALTEVRKQVVQQLLASRFPQSV